MNKLPVKPAEVPPPATATAERSGPPASGNHASAAQHDCVAQTQLLHTAKRLVRRIHERFGECRLLALAVNVERLVEAADRQLGRGVWLGRMTTCLLFPPSVAILLAAGWAVYRLDLDYQLRSASDVFQGVEAAAQTILLLLGLLLVTISLGRRVRRHAHLKVVSRLRAFAHVVDMHQLDKDPDRLIRREGDNTDQSPDLGKVSTPFLLSRYLDYCGEMLALVSKVAAMYAEQVHDPEVLAALTDVEELCSKYRFNIGIKMTSIMTLIQTK